MLLVVHQEGKKVKTRPGGGDGGGAEPCIGRHVNRIDRKDTRKDIPYYQQLQMKIRSRFQEKKRDSIIIKCSSRNKDSAVDSLCVC